MKHFKIITNKLSTAMRFGAITGISCLSLFFEIREAQAQQDSSPKLNVMPLDILKEAFDRMNHAATLLTVEDIDVSKQVKVKVTVSKKFLPDGFRLERTDSNDTDTHVPPHLHNHRVLIKNEQGLWEIFGDHHKEAMLLQYKINQEKSLDAIYENRNTPPLNGKNEFKIVEEYYNGIPAYKITMKLCDDAYQDVLTKMKQEIDVTISKQIEEVNVMRRNTPGHRDSAIPEADSRTPYAYEFVVAKEPKIIWSIKTYTNSGELLTDHHYSKIDIGIPLADDLFTIPDGIKKTIATSFTDYMKIKIQQH